MTQPSQHARNSINPDLRSLDALIAQHIMGLRHLAPVANRRGDWWSTGVRTDAFGWMTEVAYKLPEYTASWAEAGNIVEILRVRGWYFGLSVSGREIDTDPVWEAGFSHYPDPEGEAEVFLVRSYTAPLAICMAALKAVGVQW